MLNDMFNGDKDSELTIALRAHCVKTGQSFMALYHLLYNTPGIEFSVITFINNGSNSTITIDSKNNGTAIITDKDPIFVK